MVNLTVVAGDCSNDTKRSLRDVPPAHYTLQIDSFSDLQKMLSDSGATKYESSSFEVGGYKWKLCLYPNGDVERNGEEYISIYLAIVEADALPLGWNVHVKLKFFIYHHTVDKFLKIQDGEKRAWRFDRTKIECGFPKMISQTDFYDSNGGYLRRDRCIFGVEIDMCSSLGKGELVSPIKDLTCSYTWKINKFSTLEESYRSEVFTLANYKWKLELINPKGGDGKHVSLYLYSQQRERLYVVYKLSILDQKNIKDESITDHSWFSTDAMAWSYRMFISLNDLIDESKGFLMSDSLCVELWILGISTVKIIS